MDSINLDDFPEIPKGSLLNYNNHYDLYQVYKGTTRVDPKTGKTKRSRITIGSIKNGVFTFSKTYLLNQEKQALIEKLKAVEKGERQIKQKRTKEIKTQVDQVNDKVNEALKASSFDTRNPLRIEIPMQTIAMGTLMSALTGATDCEEISDAIENSYNNFWNKYCPSLKVKQISHDTVRNTMMLVRNEAFDEFYMRLTTPLVRCLKDRIVSADGQACRATALTDKENEELHGTRMLMNIYDKTNRVVLSHKLIDKKTNEISVGPGMIKQLNLEGAVVTADAMSCQVTFIDSVMSSGAHYCLSLKGNQDKSLEEVRYLFNVTNKDQMLELEQKPILEHGRIEERKISVIRGKLLSRELKNKWSGLSGGSIVKIESKRTQKTTDKTSTEDRYYITSLEPKEENLERILEVIREHWGIENNLHWVLDMRFNQDRMQANNPLYIANRSALNKLALAMLENYRFWLWDHKRDSKPQSIKIMQQRCRVPEVAIECLACGLGLL